MKAFQILFGFMAVFALVWLLFYERRQSSTPSTSERVLAYGWLVFRRLVCFLVAAFFSFVAVGVVLAAKTGAFSFSSVGAFLVCCFIAFIAAWVGVYGGGRRRGSWDERAVHQERKKRYGWRW
jgi:hypothetical protein